VKIDDTAHITPTNEWELTGMIRRAHDDFMSDSFTSKGPSGFDEAGCQDVIHSFYLPLRVKMDCVPGTPTEFYFTPTMTTEEMREYLSKQPWWQGINLKRTNLGGKLSNMNWLALSYAENRILVWSVR